MESSRCLSELDFPRGDRNAIGEASSDALLLRLRLLRDGKRNCKDLPFSGQNDLFAGLEVWGELGDSGLGDFEVGEASTDLGVDTGDALAEEGLDLESLGSFMITKMWEKRSWRKQSFRVDSK